MNQQQLIVSALIKEADAKEAKAIANLQNYMANPVGVGEHPDIVSECMKLIKEIADARETISIITQIWKPEELNEKTNSEN